MNDKTLSITITNLTEEQYKAFINLFAIMQWCGKRGASRTIKIYADGDGTFRPIFNGLNSKSILGESFDIPPCHYVYIDMDSDMVRYFKETSK